MNKEINVCVTPKLLREIADSFEEGAKDYDEESLKNTELCVFYGIPLEDEKITVFLQWHPSKLLP